MTPVDLLANNRWAAIDELVNHLVSSGKLQPAHFDGVVAAVKKRETSMSTAVGHGVGLPHASTDLVTDLVSIYGRSKDGIDFESQDGKPVHRVCLFLVPQGQFQKHLQALADIAKLMHSAEFRQGVE